MPNKHLTPTPLLPLTLLRPPRTRSSDLAAKVREIVNATQEYMTLETLTAEEGGCVLLQTIGSPKHPLSPPSPLLLLLVGSRRALLTTPPQSHRSYKASIDLVTVDFHAATRSTEPPLRVFLNFGEHGRELITTDVGLHLLKLLARCVGVRERGRSRAGSGSAAEAWPNLPEGACGRDAAQRSSLVSTPSACARRGPERAAQTGGAPLSAEALRRTVFKIVPNENNNGRDKARGAAPSPPLAPSPHPSPLPLTPPPTPRPPQVEAGELCLRKNGRGVDTNRNWEVDWGKKEKDYDPYEEYPGTRPFSEPEALMLRESVERFRPHAWVNVHSGMEAMFLPYDHKATEAEGARTRFLSSHVIILACISRWRSFPPR